MKSTKIASLFRGVMPSLISEYMIMKRLDIPVEAVIGALFLIPILATLSDEMLHLWISSMFPALPSSAVSLFASLPGTFLGLAGMVLYAYWRSSNNVE